MSSGTTPVGNQVENHNTTTPATTGGNQGAGGLDNLLPKVAGGAPARIYLNEKIVPYLLEGMKDIAREQYVHNNPAPGDCSKNHANANFLSLQDRRIH